MSEVWKCEWCACVGCSEGNCCDHGKFREDGSFDARQPHRLAVRVVSGHENAIGGEFVVEDQFGTMYKWIVNCIEEPRYISVPKFLIDRLQTGIGLEMYDIYPEKKELVRVFQEGLL